MVNITLFIRDSLHHRWWSQDFGNKINSISITISFNSFQTRIHKRKQETHPLEDCCGKNPSEYFWIMLNLWIFLNLLLNVEFSGGSLISMIHETFLPSYLCKDGPRFEELQNIGGSGFFGEERTMEPSVDPADKPLGKGCSTSCLMFFFMCFYVCFFSFRGFGRRLWCVDVSHPLKGLHFIYCHTVLPGTCQSYRILTVDNLITMDVIMERRWVDVDFWSEKSPKISRIVLGNLVEGPEQKMEFTRPFLMWVGNVRF